MKSLLTTEQVAELLSLSDTKVRNLVRSHALKAINVAGSGTVRKTYRFRPEWVEEYISENLEQSKAKSTSKRAKSAAKGGRY